MEKMSWMSGNKNSLPSMVQAVSVIPSSRSSPSSTIPLTTNATVVQATPTISSSTPPATETSRRGGAKKNSKNICINCGTNTATLWRRIKSPEEIELKRPGLVAQRDFPQYTGKLACNSCALYWSLHGVRSKRIFLGLNKILETSSSLRKHAGNSPTAKSQEKFRENCKS